MGQLARRTQDEKGLLFSDLGRAPVKHEALWALSAKSVYSSFSMKIVLKCVHIRSVDFLVKDDVPETVFLRMQ